VYRPDVVGWRRTRVPERPRGRPIRVRPDWVAEILSLTSAETDLGKKLFAYQRAAVPHYWIIDPEHERVHAPPFEELELRVAELFGD
jgi:Uma2 family endonuclease